MCCVYMPVSRRVDEWLLQGEGNQRWLFCKFWLSLPFILTIGLLQKWTLVRMLLGVGLEL